MSDDELSRSIWQTLWSNSKWLLSILGLIWPEPSLPLDQAKPLLYLTRFILSILIACVMFWTARWDKYIHATLWFRLTIASLVLFVSAWFLNDALRQRWVCIYDGNTYVMGSSADLTSNGLEQVRKPLCQGGCQNLIHNCGHDVPENLWSSSGIAFNRRILVLVYFSMLPLFVLCVTGTIQIVLCLKKPDPRLDFTGSWQGSLGLVTLEVILSLSPDKRSVSGALTYEQNIAEENFKTDTKIEESWFERDSLFFETKERGEQQRHQMIVVDSSVGVAVLKRQNEDKKYIHYCDLKKVMV